MKAEDRRSRILQLNEKSQRQAAEQRRRAEAATMAREDELALRVRAARRARRRELEAHRDAMALEDRRSRILSEHINLEITVQWRHPPPTPTSDHPPLTTRWHPACVP